MKSLRFIVFLWFKRLISQRESSIIMKQVLFLSVFLITFYNYSVAQIKPTQLTCEYMDNPSVVDAP